MSSQQFLPRKAANSSIMGKRRRTALAVSHTEGQKWLMLSCRSFSGHSSDDVTTIFAEQGSR